MWRGRCARFARDFWLGVAREAFPAAFAPKAAFAHAAKPCGGVHHVGAVDPDDACDEFWCDVEREVDVLGPDGGREPVARVVGDLHGFRGCAEGGGNQHGAEDFGLHQVRCGVQACDQGRRVEAAFGGRRLEYFAFGVVRDQLGDHVALGRVHDGADVDAFVERVADAQASHAGFEFGVEAVCDAFLHQQARARAADLPLVEPDCVDKTFDGRVDVGVVENDVGGFAAKFQGQGFA